VRVALDLTPLAGPPSGIRECTSHLAAGLALRHEVLGYVLSARAGALADWHGPLTRIRVPGRLAVALAALGLARDLGHLTRQVKLVHATNFAALGGWRLPTLLTIYDLTPLRYPEYCTPTVRAAFRVTIRNLREGAFVHTPSRAVAEEVTATLGVPASRVRAIPLGLGHEVAPRAVPGLQGIAPIVLYLGTLEPRKGLDDLIEAFPALPGSPHLVLAGRVGWGVEGLLTRIETVPWRERIHLVGQVDDHEREWLYRHATVFVFPSHYEGFGLPPLEAMRRGVPVVTTSAGALAEVTAGGARLVPPRTPEQLAEALRELLDDPEARSALAREGQRVASRYDWDRTVEGLAALYEELVA